MRKNSTYILLGIFTMVLLNFQNCSEVEFTDLAGESIAVQDVTAPTDVPTSDLEDIEEIEEIEEIVEIVESQQDNCLVNPMDCDETLPYVNTPGVVTILVALGDAFNGDNVINEASSKLLASDMVKYASPVIAPNILLVLDSNNNGEDPEDFKFIQEVLLDGMKVTSINEPEDGLTAELLADYDLVWFNNPGHRMGKIETRDALLAFPGGVILSGDDLTMGKSFSLESLTGLTYQGNGDILTCDGDEFSFDNNGGSKYDISLDAKVFPGVGDDVLNFQYGNDIDFSTVSMGMGPTSNNKLEVLAYATAEYGDCVDQLPVVARYSK